MHLADLGARVIKVERPVSGDDTRGWGPPFDDRGLSAYFLCVNRNKASIALDLANADDRAVLAKLILSADVVLDNFRAGALQRLGLDPEVFLQQQPRLIWCTISGFGADNDRPGYDFVAQAESGWMAVTGEPQGDPMKSGVPLADVIAGKDAAIAILGALVERDQGGTAAPPAPARRLEISLFHSAVAALGNVAQNVLVSGRDAARWGNAHPNLVPYQLFRAADRPMVIAVGSDGQWQAACRVLGLEELARDASLATNTGRVEQRDRVARGIAGVVATRPAAHWLGALAAAGVPCGVVRSVVEALRASSASAQTGVSPSTPGSVRLLPPALDEHGALIRAHGWDAFRYIPGAPPT
jgi:crotonobetainyl-CoA:carnitine CoA-transferase CaiB-like acyl-CoA transferase